MVRLACAFGIALVTCAACTKFGANAETPAVDAGPSGDGAPATDDASTPDAGLFSAPPQLFDDFERPDLPNGGPLSLELTTNVGTSSWAESTCDGSPPACASQTILFRALIFPGGGGGSWLSAPLVASVRQVRLDFGAELIGPNDDPGRISQAQLASFAFSNDRYVFFEVRDGSLYLGDQFKKADGSGYDNEEIVVTAVSSGWHRYQILVDLDRASATVARDDVVFSPKPIRAQILAETPLAVRLGTTYTDGKSVFQQAVDNVGLSQLPAP